MSATFNVTSVGEPLSTYPIAVVTSDTLKLALYFANLPKTTNFPVAVSKVVGEMPASEQ